MANEAGDWFRGLGSASQGGSGNWFRQGDYLAEVVTLTRRVSSDPKKREARMIIAELRVVEVVRVDEIAAPHRVGEICSVAVNLDGAYPSMERGKLKGILSALLGADAASDAAGWEELAWKVTTPPGTILAGARLLVSGRTVTTRAGKQICGLHFLPPPPAK